MRNTVARWDATLVGRSQALLDVLRRVERVGPTEATVLILGERGTGKELIARAIAACSRRQGRPFVTVNCAALPPELLASELFGHERGAFTGARERTTGVLASAHGGTLFLDEIGDLPLAGQSMLLRFLQEGEVRRVGAAATELVTVRVIAATNRDLSGAIKDGGFRPDLLDRLSDVTLVVPPLRERVEDIPLLAEHFLTHHARRHGLPRPVLTADALRRLRSHSWPGNIRELEKALARAVIFCQDGQVRPLDLEIHDTQPSVGMPGRDATARELTERQRRIVQLSLEHGVIRRSDIVRRFGISGEAARRDLQALAQHGLLRRQGRRRGSRYAPARFEQ